ncbi:MAG: zinc ribbon domain-containing protein, partial [Gemmatimonadaceae bacterium]
MALPEGIIPLATGTVLALAALSVVLSPLLSTDESLDDLSVKPSPAKKNVEGTAVAALREIEFDKATGKLSDKDYESLRASYTRDALAELRAEDNADVELVSVNGSVTDDMVEAAIRRAKNSIQDCSVCGPRPELDAIFCSSCGRYLAGNCNNCGTPVELVEARFCIGCGD